MKTDEIRRRFLDFFKQRDHVIVPSDSLIPHNDPTLLFTGAGMNQFKDMFLGKGRPKFRRAASCQKCLRTADVEKVGKTSFHLTFFEMLGNFSFGDYFKRDAILWAWELVTEELKFPEKQLVATIYQDDDESFDIWRRLIGLSADRIYRFGAKENFWPANAPSEGPNGVCGPCSEIHYDQGDDFGCRRSECAPDCDCDRFVEIWNLVFTQFDRRDGGVLEPLPQRNIDTGMGLERTAAVMQGKQAALETDIFTPVVEKAAKAIGVQYDPHSDGSSRLRRIVDHARAVTFCIADGVLPGNEGRGYVVRRLIRRAVADGWQLGSRDAFIHTLIPVISQVMGAAYPDASERSENIARIIQNEEERFLHTIQHGWREMQDRIKSLKQSGSKVMSGSEAFYLADTLGFPLEFTEMLLAQEGLSIDNENFEKQMARQRERSRAGSQISGEIFDTGPLGKVKEVAPPTEFVGYEKSKCAAKIVALLQGDSLVDSVSDGELTVILDRTPFYGEAGGQIGDAGVLRAPKLEVQIKDSKKAEDYVLHQGHIVKGAISTGQDVTAEVDRDRRLATMRNHTATHLLHHALREVLGKHAEQSGSLVAPHRLRFDFTHFAAVPPEDLEKISTIVNRYIMADKTVRCRETTLEDARNSGAIALFGEKYGETVRVVQIGNFSKELCGGTHCRRTGEIGLFKIISEQSVAAGIRRIEAVTGDAALELVAHREEVLKELCEALNVGPEGLLNKVTALSHELKEMTKELRQAKRAKSSTSLHDIFESSSESKDTRIISHKLEGMSADGLRSAADTLKRMGESTAIALGTIENGRPIVIISLSEDLIERGLHAGALAKEVAKILEGGGGGKPHMAQAGGKRADRLDESLKGAEELFREMLR